MTTFYRRMRMHSTETADGLIWELTLIVFGWQVLPAFIEFFLG